MIHQDKGCWSLKNFYDDAESHSVYQHPVCSSHSYYKLLVCTIIWACVLLYCVTDLMHVLQQSALVRTMINIQHKDNTLQNTDTP